MQKVFVISGTLNKRICIFYDKQTNKWISIPSVIQSREGIAYTVFEEKYSCVRWFKKIEKSKPTKCKRKKISNFDISS